jgi:hypothetical protein
MQVASVHDGTWSVARADRGTVTDDRTGWKNAYQWAD